jgi:hypothetical protein
MKAVKIILAIAVIAAIGFITWKWLAGVEPPPPPPPPDNQFTAQIEKELDSLSKAPDDRFCKEFYNELSYHIDDYYKNSRFSENQPENERWRDNFLKNLHSIYSDRFIGQAFYVFNGSQWDIPDLRFIIDEYKILRNSPLLEKNSPVDKKLTEIQQIINKYNEIASFVTDCRSFSCTSYGLSDKFPVSEVETKISRARTYLNNRLDNTYVNNCSRLKEEVKTVPLILFNKHAGYLNEKIKYWSGRYTKCETQSDYANTLYTPLNGEINSMSNSIYNVEVSVFDDRYQRLTDLLKTDSRNAYNHFKN